MHKHETRRGLFSSRAKAFANIKALRPTRWRAIRKAAMSTVGGLVCLTFAGMSHATQAQQVRQPLPLKVAVGTHGHNPRSSFEWSPDGKWIAHTWETEDTVPQGYGYTPTGVPLAEGNDRKQVSVTNVESGESIVLGDTKSYNWAPVWSPDGSRVAFYSDAGGEAGIWIWDKATNKSQWFPGIVARPFFGYEVIRWSADGKKLLAKVLPTGLTVTQANALIPQVDSGLQFPSVGPDSPSVVVRTAGGKTKGDGADAAKSESNDFMNRSLADVAILTLADHRVNRIAVRAKPGWFEFSPDQKYVAYSALGGFVPNTQQGTQDIFVYSVQDGKTRKLAAGVYMGYGIELNWSPDSTKLAYIASGQMGKGDVSVISISDGTVANPKWKDKPMFYNSEGEWPPLWDASGKNIYGIGSDNKLWKVEIASGETSVAGDIPDHKIVGLVTESERRKLWSTDSGNSLWVVAHEIRGTKQGIFRIDLNSGKSSPVVEDQRVYSDVFNLTGSDVGGEIAYIARDQQHLRDVWVLDTATGKTHQASHLNAAIEHYELGNARVIDWNGMDGQRLHGALLLPPGYQQGRKLPLVVWIYGGMNGSEYVNAFGFWGDYPQFDFHILATRGYAILFPDAPLGPGTPMSDLIKTVIPGVDAAILQGYADPDRIAVMGQSYGSYCSLALIAQSKRFKAAVITAAVLNPDLFTAYLEGTGYYEHGQGNMLGTIWEYPDRYHENSPLFKFDQIETPLLIGQGAKDGNLTASQATFEGLKRLDKEVEYRVYEGEGHVLSKAPNVLDFWQRRLDFLAQHLNLAVDADGAILFDGDRARSPKD